MAEPFAEWIGRSMEVADTVTEGPIRRLAATLDHDAGHWPDGAVPPLGHWLFGLPDAPQSALGPDGHPRRGGFFPPIDQPRRMWAGGRVEFRSPIAIGAAFRRKTTIQSIEEKKSGAMTLLTLLHEVFADDVLAIREEQDLVYLPITAPATPRLVDHPAPETSRRMSSDATLLFRYSALTFNAHRIHYDPDYSREVELYPGLVLHGPLQATLLIDHALRDGLTPTQFDYRARSPLYAGEPFTVARADGELWVEKDDGTVTMTASIA